jgi:hypothetical protein
MNPRLRPAFIIAAISTAIGLSPGIGVARQTPAASNRGAIVGSISGRITLDGSPLSGERVAVLAVSPTSTQGSTLMSLGQTDRDGRYRLEDIPPGRYYIVTGPLEAPVYYPGVRTKTEAVIVTVVAGPVLGGQDFPLRAPITATISGRVIREGHSAGTIVTLTTLRPIAGRNISRPQAIANAAIGPDDRFEFKNVLPGDYTAVVGPNLDERAVFPIAVTDKNVTGLEWVIPAAYVARAPVRFTVRMDCDCRVPPVTLRFTSERSATDPEISGSYLLQLPSEAIAIPVGEARIAVEYTEAAWTPIPLGFTVTGIRAGDRDLSVTPLQVGPNGAPDVTIHIGLPTPAPWVRINGQVTGLATASVRATSIRISGGPILNPIEAPINADGVFEFPKVLPGSYVAELHPSADPFPRHLSVKTSGLLDVRIPMEIPFAKVKGRIKDYDPRKLFPGLTVSVELGILNMKSNVAADGTFSFDAVPRGTFEAYVVVCGELCSFESSTKLTVADKDIDKLELPSLRR